MTNPPIDPNREELVMSLVSFIGPCANIFDLEGNAKKKRLEVREPILTNGDLEKSVPSGISRRLSTRRLRYHLSFGKRRGRHAGGP